MSIILGLHDGHDASAALMIDGKIVSAAQEERFSGLKGDYGFPKKAIEFCLNYSGIKSADIDHVALSGRFLNPVLTYIKRNAQFTVTDWIVEQDKYWKPKLYDNVPKVDYYTIEPTHKLKNHDKIRGDARG